MASSAEGAEASASCQGGAAPQPTAARLRLSRAEFAHAKPESVPVPLGLAGPWLASQPRPQPAKES